MVAAKPTTPVLNTGDAQYPNLICALPFMDGLGSTASDLSGTGRPGTLNSGAIWFNDPTIGTVVQLDGSTGFVTLSNTLNAALLASLFGVTVSMWLRLRLDQPTVATKTGLATIQALNTGAAASKWPAGGTVAGEANGQGYLSTFRDGSGRVDGIVLGATDKAQWHLLTITSQAGGNWKAYLNGVLLTTVVSDNPIGATLTAILGQSVADSNGGPYYLDGWLGDFRVWARELIAPEVLSLFNSPWTLYTVSAPIGQERFVGVEADATLYLPQSGKFLGVMADVRAQDHSHSARDLALMADLVPYHDVLAGTLPPNDPGLFPLDVANVFDPRRKPDNSPAPALNADSINTGTLLAFPFTEGAGATASDRSGNTNDGTLNNGASLSAVSSFRTRTRTFSTALSFPNSNSNVSVPRTPALEPTLWSIAGWVTTPAADPGTIQVMLGKAVTSPGGAVWSYLLGIRSGPMRAYAEMADVIDAPDPVTGATTLAASTLYHLAVTWDGSVLRLYVNGKLDASVNNTGSTSYDAANDVILGNNAANTNRLTGVMDAIQLWSRALSTDEVAQLYDTEGAGATIGGSANAGTGAWGPYDTSALAIHVGIMADVSFCQPAIGSRYVGIMADVNPQGAPIAARYLGIMADIIPAISNPAGLAIGSCTPNIGPVSGGQQVTIRGYGFRNVTQVLVGGVLLTSMSVVNETTIVGTTQIASQGMADVRVDSSSLGTTISSNLYQYVAGMTAASQALWRGKQMYVGAAHQEGPFTGMTAAIGAVLDTILPFTLTDKPVAPLFVEVYVQRAGDQGGGQMRQGTGLDFTVDISNKKIVWLHTATFNLISTDSMMVVYTGQN